MDFNEAKAKLEKYGQVHVLRYYDELSDEQKNNLIAEIERVDFEPIIMKPAESLAGDIQPMSAMKISEIEEKRTELEAAGLELIRAGKTAALLLAGGQGSRLGVEGPKGAVNVGITRDLYIFECLINNLTDVVKKAGTVIPLFIMTSEKNDAETREFFAAHDYFGYDSSNIFFFIQEMAPATDFEGNVYLEAKDHIALSPNGNGGWFKSMLGAGLDKVIADRGIEWINIFAVDNVLQRMMDPAFIGATAGAGCEVGAKVISKAYPEEKVGVLCYRDGRPSIVEYYDLNEEMMYMKDENGDLAYNSGVILNYLFRIDALMRIAGNDMPLHKAVKKISYLDDKGEPVKPEENNGYKYETLVLDMIEMMNGCFAFEVDRNKEFAPIKNLHGKDSLDSAREMLAAYGVEL
ncbi:MAG: UTP--glucose-1-phosphate uridylyltransferase [Parasporobacterium sp.]|nr:UTP--glucose-1-phosphate uridylyltransferase [Parasporobacterium sp.]